MKYYFAGSIKGGRDKVDIFQIINEYLNNHGEVLDKHVADPNVLTLEGDKTPEEIYLRDIKWIKECDMLVAEVSTPSLGVGYELSYAEQLNKDIIVIYDSKVKVSSMILGNEYFKKISYNNSEDLINKLSNIIE